MHNNRGGLLVFGIDDKTYKFAGATRVLDSKMFNDRIRKYVGDTIWVDYHREYIQSDQRYLGVALIPPRGPSIARFKAAAPVLNGSQLFSKTDSALRANDSTTILPSIEADRLARQETAPVFGERFLVDEPYYRVLAPDYTNFLERGQLGRTIELSLRDPRIAVTSLIGVGGMGKTALATWAALRAYEEQDFKFIVSTTAKDRELSSSGILGLRAVLTSYEDLLDQICDVLGLAELKSEPVETRGREVKALLADSNGLLYVDNLETVDDSRLIAFLDDLPVGVRAIVTSRRHSVRTAARPIDIPPLTDREIVAFLRLLGTEPGHEHIEGLKDSEALTLGRAWDGIPLAIRWAISRTRSAPEILGQAGAPTGKRLHGEQLLEFSFRRVFEGLTATERSVLEALSILEQPLPTEALIAACAAPDSQALDAVDELVADGLVQRVFDPDRNDYCFTTLPITRAFIRSDLQKRAGIRAYQRRLTAWFEATDVGHRDERLLVREIRSGKSADDSALVDLAIAAERRGDLESADRLFAQALTRNPRSWKAAYSGAEFYRHKRHDPIEALRLYEIAGANAPKVGADRHRIHREWGLLLRDSGIPNASREAEDKLEIALEANSSDPIARHALATCLEKRGAYQRIVEVLEPMSASRDPRTRAQTLPILLRAYESLSELVKAAELRRDLDL
jgi:tetratricopeptide (TPR) repeat protein